MTHTHTQSQRPVFFKFQANLHKLVGNGVLANAGEAVDENEGARHGFGGW